MGVASIALILGLQGASAKTLRERLMPLIRKTQPDTKRVAHREIWVEA